MASSLEQTLVLAEEYINGDPRAYDMPVDQIPCRVAGNCGVWVGTDSSGNAIRGPVRLNIGDSEEREDRAVAAATMLRDQFDVPAIIGPCTSSEMAMVFENVTHKD